MAAEHKSKALTRRPVLLSKIEGSQDVVNMAAIIPKEDGVISVSEDRTIRVWMKRDSGQYWPSVYHSMSSSCSCMSFNPETRRLSVGLDNGTISDMGLSHILFTAGLDTFLPFKYLREAFPLDHLKTSSRLSAIGRQLSYLEILDGSITLCNPFVKLPCGEFISLPMYQQEGAEFILSEDYNKMTSVKSYLAHQNRVTMVLFILEMEWVLSTGQDKSFTWHCSESGGKLGSHKTSASASCLQFDIETRHAFVGDYSGQVTILKLEQDNCSVVTTFKGHSGSITALCWDPVQRTLFSGSSDHSIIMWDIGGRKGTAIELQGHNDKVQSLCYALHTRQLISCGADGGIVVWNMDVKRQETPDWLDSDSCQKCDQPFFWNFKQMWDSKKIGLRQHHCRKCGKALCGKCSSKRSSIPLMGFEFEVRVCDSCCESITDEDRAPTATFHDSKHSVVHMAFDVTRGRLLTSGNDRIIKLWDMTPVVS